MRTIAVSTLTESHSRPCVCSDPHTGVAILITQLVCRHGGSADEYPIVCAFWGQQMSTTMKRLIPSPSSRPLVGPCFCFQSPFLRPIYQCMHTTAPRPAIPLPVTATGPPPPAPLPAASQHGQRVDRRRRQAELLKKGQDMRASNMKPGTAMKKRFWKDVSVQADNGMPLLLQSAYDAVIYLLDADSRSECRR